jgi:hypothetical protein
MDENLEAELFEEEPLESDLNANAEADLDDFDLDDEDDYDEDDYMSESEYREYLAERQAEYDDQWGDSLDMPSYAY